MTPERRAWLQKYALHIAVELAITRGRFTLGDLREQLRDIATEEDLRSTWWLDVRRLGPFKSKGGVLLPALSAAVLREQCKAGGPWAMPTGPLPG